MNIPLNLKIVTDQRNVKSFIFLHISFLYQVKFKSLWSSCLSVEELRFSLNFVTVAEQPIESSFSFLPQVSFLDHCQGNLIDNEESEHNPEIREKHGVPICKLVGPRDCIKLSIAIQRVKHCKLSSRKISEMEVHINQCCATVCDSRHKRINSHQSLANLLYRQNKSIRRYGVLFVVH